MKGYEYIEVIEKEVYECPDCVNDDDTPETKIASDKRIIERSIATPELLAMCLWENTSAIHHFTVRRKAITGSKKFTGFFNRLKKSSGRNLKKGNTFRWMKHRSKS